MITALWRKTALAGAMMALAAAAQAAPSYGNILDGASGPGVYFGSGNVNGNWTIDTTNGIEVALRAKDRATLQTIDGSGGIYYANPGLCNPICSGGNKANWNYELSVNVRADGGVADLDDFIVRLEVDTDPSALQNWVTLNVLSNWPDSAYWDGSAPRRNGSTPLPGEWGVQQSANPLFSDSGFNFLPGAGQYDIRLSVFNPQSTQGDPLASVTIQVNVVPEPGSLALVGMALAAAASLRRRKSA